MVVNSTQIRRCKSGKEIIVTAMGLSKLEMLLKQEKEMSGIRKGEVEQIAQLSKLYPEEQ